ncbi:MAG: CHAT domain-containing protein [Planctomycetota bacterium]
MPLATSISNSLAWRTFLAYVAAAVSLLEANCLAAPQASSPPAHQVSARERCAALKEQGSAQLAEGRIDDAIRTFEEVGSLAEESGDCQTAILIHADIADCHLRAARYMDVLRECRLLQTALAECPTSPHFVSVIDPAIRARISSTLRMLGRYQEALAEARGAVERMEDTDDPVARARACNALGSALFEVGRLAEAETWYARAVAEAEDLPPDDPERFDMACSYATCLGELGERDAALQIAQALVDDMESRAETAPTRAARALALRGSLYFYEDWSRAESDLTRSLEFLAAAGTAPGDLQVLQRRLYLAHAIRNTGRPQDSARIERSVLEIVEKKLGARHPLAIYATKNLAGSLWDLADLDGDGVRLQEARKLYEAAAALAAEQDDASGFTVYGPLGELLLEGFDDPGAAEPWLRRAVDSIESLSSEEGGLDAASRAAFFRQMRLHKWRDPFEGLVRCLIRLGRGEDALQVLESSRARELHRMLQRTRFDPVEAAIRDFDAAGDVQAAARLRALPGEIEAALAAMAAARASPESGERVVRSEVAAERLKDLLSERLLLTRATQGSTARTSASEIRASLGEGEVLLAYFLGRVASYACLVEPTGGQVEWFPLVDDAGRALTADTIERQALPWLASLAPTSRLPERGVSAERARPPEADAQAISARLFRSLFPERVWNAIRACSVLYLVPHGTLNWLPFEALVVSAGKDGGPPKYWIDEGPAIAYQESGSSMVWSLRRRAEQSRTSRPRDALILADPDYDSGSAPTSGSGAVVARVVRGGPGACAGLRAGDVVKSVAGSPIHDTSGLDHLLRGDSARNPREVVVIRGGVEHTIRLEPGDPGFEIVPRGDPVPSLSRTAAASDVLARLPGTAQEAQAVRATLESGAGKSSAALANVRVFRGGDATESLLYAWAPAAVLVHVAAHQIPDPLGHSDSGRIALCPPAIPTAEDDGFVDLDDLLLHWRGRLEHCELFVLSSCESRTGKLDREEGFFGLPLGLRFAGCPSVVSSLWPVDDQGTAELMSAFYERLVDGAANRVLALRDAQRALKRTRPDPNVWAAFVWTGAPR